MNVFVRLEATCAQVVERAFARVFPSDLEPAQIGRKLVALFESAPSDTYVVRVHPRDFARLSPHRAQLETQWRELLTQLGPALGAQRGPIAVVLHADPRVVAGAVSIEAVLDARPPELPRYRLAFETGPEAGRTFPLGSETTVGRAPENDVVVEDTMVSRRHARLTSTDVLAIEDLGSLNGTYVNGERVGRSRLAANDAIVIGTTKLRVVADA